MKARFQEAYENRERHRQQLADELQGQFAAAHRSRRIWRALLTLGLAFATYQALIRAPRLPTFPKAQRMAVNYRELLKHIQHQVRHQPLPPGSEPQARQPASLPIAPSRENYLKGQIPSHLLVDLSRDLNLRRPRGHGDYIAPTKTQAAKAEPKWRKGSPKPGLYRPADANDLARLAPTLRDPLYQSRFERYAVKALAPERLKADYGEYSSSR
jgi:hypothetical protein